MDSLILAAATVDASMVDGLTSTFEANVGVLIPVGITIMGVMLGVRVIPRIVYTFF